MAEHELTRRGLLQAGVAAGVGAALPSLTHAMAPSATPDRPIAISSANGLRATERAMELLRQGRDTLVAAVEGNAIIEDDPEDMSVGYGGLPNEEGVVELDASVMHGPTMRAGAVASLSNIKNPGRVAKLVMERTDHVLLVGEGALRFARAMGFQEENLLTERARLAWLRWKTRLSKEDDWLDDEEIRQDFPGIDLSSPAGETRPTGTVSTLCLNEKGELSGCTTTSGLAWKIPGRVGDSPIIGAGLYVDREIGACGSTGRGEANILVGGARTVVELMRQGRTPEQAILDVLKRVCDQTTPPRLLHRPGRPNFELNFYAIRRDGVYAGGRIYRGGRYAVHDGVQNRLRDSVYLFESPNA
jgi:N4-(beta-N-acetylglucosaminyl)-L-asparaginase